MKKRLIYLTCCLLGLLISCKQFDGQENSNSNDFVFNNNMIETKYYSKKMKTNFNNLIDNSTSTARNIANDSISLEEKGFIDLYNSLSEDEKNQLLDNINSMEVTVDSYLCFDENSDVARAAMAGDATYFDEYKQVYAFQAKLQDLFSGCYILGYMMPEDLGIEKDEEISADEAISYLSNLEDWERIESILNYLESSIKLSEIKGDYYKIKNNQETKAARSIEWNDIVDSLFYDPIENSLGEKLINGDILLMCAADKAYVIAGNWNHAGIFSEDKYRYMNNDKAHCIYTAEPSITGLYPSDMIPDKPGYACLDTVRMFTRQKKYAVLQPKNYDSKKAEKAIEYAKKGFYDKNTGYFLPINEMFFIGDTSHDMTNSNTYCSKVVYTAWKKAGVDLDGRTFAGNLVSPDDIYGSSVSWKKVLRIQILWWSKEIVLDEFNATTNVVRRRSR